MVEPTEKRPAHETLIGMVERLTNGRDYAVAASLEMLASGIETVLRVICETSFPHNHIPHMIERLTKCRDRVARVLTTHRMIGFPLICDYTLSNSFRETLESLETDMAASKAKRADLETMRSGPDCPECGFKMTAKGENAFVCPNCYYTMPRSATPSKNEKLS